MESDNDLKAFIFALFAFTLLLAGCLFKVAHEAQEAVFVTEQDERDYGDWVSTKRGPSGLSSLYALHRWARDNVEYRPDGVIDFPNAAVMTFKYKRGDCDDHAMLFIDALNLMGFDGKMLTVWHPSGGHSVCLVLDPSGFYHASNWPVIYGPFTTIEEAASSIYPDWTKAVLRDRMMKNTQEFLKGRN